MEKLGIRAWDKRKKRMIQSDEIVMISFRARVLAYKLKDEANENGFYNVRDMDDFSLLQSTDLYDRNGKEIWEGDVVEMHPSRVGVVVERNGEFWVDIGKESVLLSCCINDKQNQLEIVGDIYKREI